MSIHKSNDIVKWAVKSSRIFTRAVGRRIGDALNRLTRLPHWRRLCILSAVLVILLLVGLYRQTEDIQAAGATKSDTKTVVKEVVDDEPEPSPPKTASSKTDTSITVPDTTKSTSKKESLFTEEEVKYFNLLVQYTQMIEKKGSDDPEVQLLEKKLVDAEKAVKKKTPPPTKPTSTKVTKPTVTPDVKPTLVPPKTTKPVATPDVKPTAVQPKTTKPTKTVMVVRPKPTPATPPSISKPPAAKPTTTKPPTTRPPTAKASTTKPPKNATSSKVQSKPTSSKAVTPPAPKPASPTSPAAPPPPEKSEVKATIIKADPNSPEPSPDDIVVLTIVDNMLDVQFLIDLVAKELKLNIIYEPGQPLTGKVYIQQRGKIYRKDLQPLLEMILSLQGYSMIRDESFIRIFKRDPNVLKKKPRIVIGQEMPEVLPGETLITQIIEAQHVPVAEIQKFLVNFISDATAIKTIAGTNYLIITEYVNRLPLILDMVSLIDRPGLPRKLKAITIQHIPVRDARTHVEALLKALAAQGATTLATTTSAPPAPTSPTKPKTAAEIRAERIRELAERRKETAGGSTAAAVPQGPTLYTYDLTSQLLVIGTDSQIKQVEDLLALLDVEPPGPEIKLEIIQVEHITASGASTKVKAILDSLEQKIATVAPTAPKVAPPPTSSRTPRLPTTRTPTPQTITTAAKGPVFHLDERTNRIFLVGYEEQIQQAKELLSLIDVVAGPEIKLEVLDVKYVEPDDVATQIQSLVKALNENTAVPEGTSSRTVTPPSTSTKTPIPPTRTSTTSGTTQLYDQAQRGPAIFVDKRTSRMFVVGSEDQISQVKELLALLDVEAGKPIRLEIFRVQNVQASEIAPEIESIIKALNESSVPGIDSFQESAPIPSPTETRTSTGARITPTRLPTTTTRGRSTLALAVEQGPALFVDERNNRLLVVGNDEQIEQVKEILALLDVVEGPEIKIAVLRVQYVEAADVGPEIEKLLEALYEKGAGTITPTSSSKITPVSPTLPRPGVSPTQPTTPGQPTGRTRTAETEKKRGAAIFVDERTNRLLVVGSDEQIDQVKDLLALLDVLEGPEIKLVAVRVKYVLAVDVADQVRELLDALYEQGAYMPGVHRPGSDLTPTSTTPTAKSPTPTSGTRTTPSTQPKTSSPSQSKESGASGPVIVVDERTNRLLVVGSEEQIEQFHSILALLDVKEGPEIRLASFDIKNVIADDIATQLEELLNAFNEQGGKATRAATSSVVSTTSAAPSLQTTSATPSGTGRIPPTATAQAGKDSSTKKAEELGPFILVDSRTNRLLIVGSDEQIDQLEELLKVLDVPPSEYYRLVLKVYQPQYVEAAEVQRIMDALGITQTGEQAPRDQARAGGPGGTQSGPRSSAPASSSSGASPVGGLFSRGPGEGMLLPGQEEPEVRIAIQETTNKIYVLATEYQHRDIAEIMKHVDLETPDTGAIQIFQLENREPAVVAEMLQSLLEAEQKAKEAAGEGVEKIVTIPGKEGAPIIVALEDIYAVAVRGSKKQHEEIGNIIKQLDKRLPSVLVEAILVQVNTDDVLDLGISLQQYTDVGTSHKRTISGASPFGLSPIRSGNMVLGTGGTIAYFDDELIFATLEALQSQGNSKIASMPRVLVNDNETGTISNKRQEPTTKTTIPPGSDTQTIDFSGYEEAGTTLNIEPHISEGDFLKLTITLDVDSFDGKSTGNIPPPKSVNNVTTTVTVPNGKYIVLGGLTSKTESTKVNKVPLLGDIPIIGMAFRNVSRSDLENVLYVFVKANIVGRHEEFEDLDTLSEEYRQKLRNSEINYQGQSVIPGIPEKQKKRTSVLDN